MSLFSISKILYFMKNMKYDWFKNMLFYHIHQVTETFIGNLLNAGKTKKLNCQSCNFSQIHSWISNNSCIFIYYEFFNKEKIVLKCSLLMSLTCSKSNKHILWVFKKFIMDTGKVPSSPTSSPPPNKRTNIFAHETWIHLVQNFNLWNKIVNGKSQ